MNRSKFALLMLIPLTVITVRALMNGGITGILAFHLSPGGWQVFIDLVISLLLLLTFIVPHARAGARNPWPWVALTLVAGSFGPLLYLISDRAGWRGER